jgi:transcriptional regulator with XRE-family HTH domain
MLLSMDVDMPAAKLPLSRIRERRKILGWSQDDLAEKTGCLQTQISRYENGDALPMSDALEALARALEVSADWLLGLTDIPRPSLQTSDLDAIEVAAINAIRDTAPAQRQHVVNILQAIAKISAGK